MRSLSGIDGAAWIAIRNPFYTRFGADGRSHLEPSLRVPGSKAAASSLRRFAVQGGGIAFPPPTHIPPELRRTRIHARLQAIRDRGDWEAWLRFFLEGVATVASEATATARSIIELREEVSGQIDRRLGRRTARAQQLLDGLFQSPVVNVKDVQGITGLSQPSASKLVNALTQMNVLKELTGRRRNRLFMFSPYLRLFKERQKRS
jgi:hypothetical protein